MRMGGDPGVTRGVVGGGGGGGGGWGGPGGWGSRHPRGRGGRPRTRSRGLAEVGVVVVVGEDDGEAPRL